MYANNDQWTMKMWLSINREFNLWVSLINLNLPSQKEMGCSEKVRKKRNFPVKQPLWPDWFPDLQGALECTRRSLSHCICVCWFGRPDLRARRRQSRTSSSPAGNLTCPVSSGLISVSWTSWSSSIIGPLYRWSPRQNPPSGQVKKTQTDTVWDSQWVKLNTWGHS